MGNTAHKQTCVLNSGNIENWPESSHKITVCVNPWIVISSQKYSEFQVCHLHKQAPPPTNVPSLDLGINLNIGIIWIVCVLFACDPVKVTLKCWKVLEIKVEFCFYILLKTSRTLKLSSSPCQPQIISHQIKLYELLQHPHCQGRPFSL